MNLTSSQQKAIKYINKPLLIIAGAGTGKTTVITEKINYLISKKKIKPENILALTFTEKAANEMEERVDQVLPYGYFQTHISTFHSFCDMILRDESLNIGISPNYKLLTETETIMFFKKYLYKLSLNWFRPPNNPNKFIQGLLTHFSRLKDEDISTKEYIKWAEKYDFISEDEKLRYRELSLVYKEYNEIKKENQVLDFADLITNTLILFRNKKSILDKYKEKYKYILVDEFQDTNIAQYELIKLIAPPNKEPKLTIIGDDNQSIYKFRGASVSNILLFKEQYKNAKTIVLNDNFRSVPNILDASYRLIKNNDPDTLENKLKISKKLKSNSKYTEYDKVYYNFYQTETEENQQIANQIIKLVKNEDFKWSDITILVRANNHANSLSQTLSHNNIPYYFSGSGTLFREPEIKDLIAYLFFLNDVHDSISLYRILTSKYMDCDALDINLLLSFSKKTSRSLFDSIRMHISWFYEKDNPEEFEIYKKYAELLSQKTLEKLSSLYKMLKDQLNTLNQKNITDILYELLYQTKTIKKLLKPKTLQDEKMTLNITAFFNALQHTQNNLSDNNFQIIIDYLRMSIELGNSPINERIDQMEYEAVKIMTIHSAKGLEFPIVFIPSLTTKRFPTINRKDQIPLHDGIIKEILPTGNAHLQEERRLFYVALTRAKRRVYLSSSERYGEGKTSQKTSNFVYETLPEDYIKSALLTKENLKKQLSLFDFKKKNNINKIIKKNKPITTISYTQIQTFELCPLKYKYQYILKIPSEPSGVASIGSSVHKTLDLFYRAVKEKKEPDISDLKTIFNSTWIPIGFSSLEQEKNSKEHAWEMLQNYYNKYHTEPSNIKDTEQFFNIKIDNLKVIGVIDRVDKKDGYLEIIDYKTGSKPDEKKLKKNIQLSVYAYATTQKNLYNVPLNKITVTYYYLKDNEKLSFQKNEKDIEKMKEDIKLIVEKINNSDFKPKVGKHCEFCPYRMICEAWQ